MSITRRALLGTFIGLPFTAGVALGVPDSKPEIVDIPVTAYPAFSSRHISGIGNAILNHVEHNLACRGIRHTPDYVLDVKAGYGSFFLVPWTDDKKSYQDIVQVFAIPASEALALWLIKYYDSKARWIGVQMYYHPKGLAVSVLATQSETPPIRGNAVYSEWTEAVV